MTEQLPPILYLAHRIPYPPNKGDKVRSFNILRHLAGRYRVFLGTFIDSPQDAGHLEVLKTWCADVCAIRIDPLRQRVSSSLKGLLGNSALSLPYYHSQPLLDWVRATVSRENIELALAFSGPMAQYLAVDGLKRRVIDFCDVDSAKWTQYSESRPWPLSWVYRREGRLLSAFETRVTATSDAALFATDAEAALFERDASPAAISRVKVMQNGVDAEYFSPTHAFDDPYQYRGPKLVFTGAMDYWPNIDAVNWFALEILPLIRQERPATRLWIVGMNPSAEVRSLAGEAVTVTGGVPDVRPWLAHADVVEAPLRIARGIQNKVLEAMAMARPVVVGVAPGLGLGATDGQEVVLAETAVDFARATLDLLDDTDKANALGARARDVVLDRYGWSAHLRVLDAVLQNSSSETHNEHPPAREACPD